MSNDVRKFIAVKDVTIFKTFVSKGTVLKVLDVKVTVNGLYRKFEVLDWVDACSPIMDCLVEINQEI